MNKNRGYRSGKTSFTGRMLYFFNMFILRIISLARAMLISRNGRISIKKTIFLALTIISSIALLITITNAALIMDTNSTTYFNNGTFNSTYDNGTDIAALIPDGSIGAWTTNVNSFTTVRTLANVNNLIYNGYMYVVGGSDGTNVLSDVWYAPVNPNGSIGAWINTTGMSGPRRTGGVEFYNGYLYAILGEPTDKIEYAPVNPNGSIGAWTTIDNFPIGTCDGIATAVSNGYVYALGGRSSDCSSPFSNVYYAPVNPNGSIGAWISTTSLSSARSYVVADTSNGYIYVAGGWIAPNDQTNVEYAPINPNGSIGAWISTTSLLFADSITNIKIHNGYIYQTGGEHASNINTARYAFINPNGSIGAWISTTNLPASTHSHGSDAYNGYLYLIGGNVGGSYSNSVRYAPFQLNYTRPSSVGNFTSMIFDANGSSTTWNNISWIEEVPYGEELPNNGIDEIANGLPSGANMSGNVLLMHFNNQSSYGENESNVTDFSGRNNHGTSSGTTVPPTNTTTKVFGAASKTFDGVNDYINLGDVDVQNNGNGYSIGLWAKYTATGFRFLVGKRDAGTSNGEWNFAINNAGNDLSFNTWVGGGTNDNLQTANVGINDNNWHHLTATFSASNGVKKIYVDGVQAATSTTTSGTPAGTSASLMIGQVQQYQGGANYWYNGSMDEVAIWNRSLTAAEIRNHYLRGALNLSFQVRSCDDSACNGESFVGGDNTANTFFRNATFNSLSNISLNRWFQYKAYFTSNNINYTPVLKEVNINYIDGAVTDETISNNAIVTGIQNVIPAATIYANQQVYIVNSSGSQTLGRFDRVAAFGNQRWAFNYNNTGESYTNMKGLGNTLFIWENTSLNFAQITQQVQDLINKTRA